MNGQKKSLAGVGTPNQAGGTKATGNDQNNSHPHPTTSPPGAQEKLSPARIYERLGAGPARGKGLRQLAGEMGMDQRELRRLISRERKAGSLILSDNRHGYFRPASPGEVEQFIRSMSHRSREIGTIVRAAQEALDRYTGQQRMGGW